MKSSRLVLLALTFLTLGCAPAATSLSSNGIIYEHEGFRIGDSVPADLSKLGAAQPDGSVAISIESKNLPHYQQTQLFLLDNKIAEIGSDFSKEQVNEVYAYNEKKFGKPDRSNEKLWLWKLKEGGVFILNREGWGKATSEKMLTRRGQL